MYFKSIEDILNSGILSERISEGFSDNVLKSTRLEREIFRDIRDKTPEIKEAANQRCFSGILYDYA